MKQFIPSAICCTALIAGQSAWGQNNTDDDTSAPFDFRCVLAYKWEQVRPDTYYLEGDAFRLNPQYGAAPLAEAAREELGDEEGRKDVLRAERCKSPAVLFLRGWFYDIEGRASDRESEKVVHRRLAFSFYELAAQAGYPWAESNICTRLMHGYGVSPNYADALRWCQSAASKGAAFAQQQLAVMYWNGGMGVEKDVSEAYFWYLVALPDLPGSPMLDRASAEQRLRQAEELITPEQIDRLQRRASDFRPSVDDWREGFKPIVESPQLRN